MTAEWVRREDNALNCLDEGGEGCLAVRAHLSCVYATVRRQVRDIYKGHGDGEASLPPCIGARPPESKIYDVVTG